MAEEKIWQRKKYGGDDKSRRSTESATFLLGIEGKHC